jgi:hypothetical protein
VPAAFTAFEDWLVHGTPPPSPPPFQLANTHPATLGRDAHGNVIGGVRTPAVNVPISALSGQAPSGTSVLCSLFGSSTPFSTATLHALYPTKADYVAEYTKSLDSAISGGFILPADRAEMLAQANQAPIPD